MLGSGDLGVGRGGIIRLRDGMGMGFFGVEEVF